MCSILPRPRLTSHPVDVGHRAEAAILSELVRRGYRILLPFGVNQRYDLVLDCDGRFLRAQCKSGRLRAGVIQFSPMSIQSNTKGTRVRGYTGEVDLFIVYCAENHCVYVIPADEVPNSQMHLRIDPPRNRQSKRVRWAKDYELPA
ncbi:MAG TPA: group I intron-associated PD-(D/E)XK endonuclease [Solirubrobacterales bacterium]